MASCAFEQFFGRLRWLPVFSPTATPECIQYPEGEQAKLFHDLKLARHDAVMAEAALRAHLANNSLAAVPAGDFEALVVDTIRLVGRCREALENLDRLSCRAKAMGVQS